MNASIFHNRLSTLKERMNTSAFYLLINRLSKNKNKKIFLLKINPMINLIISKMESFTHDKLFQ